MFYRSPELLGNSWRDFHIFMDLVQNNNREQQPANVSLEPCVQMPLKHYNNKNNWNRQNIQRYGFKVTVVPLTFCLPVHLSKLEGLAGIAVMYINIHRLTLPNQEGVRVGVGGCNGFVRQPFLFFHSLFCYASFFVSLTGIHLSAHRPLTSSQLRLLLLLLRLTIMMFSQLKLADISSKEVSQPKP